MSPPFFTQRLNITSLRMYINCYSPSVNHPLYTWVTYVCSNSAQVPFFTQQLNMFTHFLQELLMDDLLRSSNSSVLDPRQLCFNAFKLTTLETKSHPHDTIHPHLHINVIRATQELKIGFEVLNLQVLETSLISEAVNLLQQQSRRIQLWLKATHISIRRHQTTWIRLCY